MCLHFRPHLVGWRNRNNNNNNRILKKGLLKVKTLVHQQLTVRWEHTELCCLSRDLGPSLGPSPSAAQRPRCVQEHVKALLTAA